MRLVISCSFLRGLSELGNVKHLSGKGSRSKTDNDWIRHILVKWGERSFHPTSNGTHEVMKPRCEVMWRKRSVQVVTSGKLYCYGNIDA